MGKIKNTFDVLMVSLNTFVSLNGNIAGGALLTNAFQVIDRQMKDL